MKKLTLSALIASSLLIAACDQQSEAPEAVTETSTTLVEETVEVTTEVVEDVTETASDAVDSAAEEINEATSSEAAEMQAVNEMLAAEEAAEMQEINDMIAAAEIAVDEIMEKAAELAQDPEALDEEKVKEAAADLL